MKNVPLKPFEKCDHSMYKVGTTIVGYFYQKMLTMSDSQRESHSRGDSWVAKTDSFRRKPTSKYSDPKICAVCLSNRGHDMRYCRAATTWNGKATRTTRDKGGRLVDGDGRVLCVNWQRSDGCQVSNEGHRHECSGCGSPRHGASGCALAEGQRSDDAAEA